MSMNCRNITLITTWDNEVIEVEIDFDTWLSKKNEAKKQWLDWVLLKKQKRFVKFANIKDEQWKTRYFEEKKRIEAPKRELTEEERQKRNKFIIFCLEKTKENRRKNFIEERERILNNLAKMEKSWWMETTKSKLDKLAYYIKQEKIWQIQQQNKN